MIGWKKGWRRQLSQLKNGQGEVLSGVHGWSNKKVLSLMGRRS